MKKKIFFHFFILNVTFLCVFKFTLLIAPTSQASEENKKSVKETSLPRIPPTSLKEEPFFLEEPLSPSSSKKSSSENSKSSSKLSLKSLLSPFTSLKKTKKMKDETSLSHLLEEELEGESSENSPSLITKKNASGLNTKQAFFRMILSLVLLLGLGGGFIFCLNWWKRKYHSTTQHKQIHITSQFYLDSKKRLMIVQVAGEHLLLSITDQNISLIKPLSLLEENSSLESETHFMDQFLKPKISSPPKNSSPSPPQNSSSSHHDFSPTKTEQLSFSPTQKKEQKEKEIKENSLSKHITQNVNTNLTELTKNVEDKQIENIESIRSFVEKKLRNKRRIG